MNKLEEREGGEKEWESGKGREEWKEGKGKEREREGGEEEVTLFNKPVLIHKP